MRFKKFGNFQYDPVSIIMPVLNNCEYTKNCIESLKKNTSQKCELIIIDNNSNDETSSYVQSLSLPENIELNYIQNQDNKGVAPSWNQGIKNSKYEYIAIINNDIEFMTPDWLECLQKKLKNNKNIYWTSPRTVYTKNTNKISYKIHHYEQLVYGKTNKDSYVVACCFMCPKHIFEEKNIGLFDEQFSIAYYEDLDFINRILAAKKFVSMCQSVMVFHAVGRTSRITSSDGKNEIRYNEKWGNSKYNILAMQSYSQKRNKK